MTGHRKPARVMRRRRNALTIRVAVSAVVALSAVGGYVYTADTEDDALFSGGGDHLAAPATPQRAHQVAPSPGAPSVTALVAPAPPPPRAQPVQASPPPGRAAPPPSEANPDPSGLRRFTSAQFVDLFYETDLPGTAPVTTPPPITDHDGADARIRSIAEDRGYRLQAEATVGLSSVDGRPAQPAVAAAWRDLADAAAADGVSIAVTSAYRSIEDQRDIFLDRLDNHGDFTNEEIAAGDADGAIDAVLQTSSIPGYSKHHTGYAVDAWDYKVELPLARFGETPAYEWMAADNFANAKRFGFVPSYPHGVHQQGPMPEEWEFVWVGTGPLHH